MFNFENIGGKIKTLAVIITVVGIGVSVFCGIFMLSKHAGYGLLTIIAGSLVSWISSFFMYGFGELIEKTTEIAKNTKQGVKIELETKEEKSTN